MVSIQDSINTLLYDQPSAFILKNMLLIDDIALTHEVFEFIDRQFDQACFTLDEAKKLIELLPSKVDAYPPATQRCLANIFSKTKTATSALPAFDINTMLPTVASVWLKTEASLQPPDLYAASLCESARCQTKTRPFSQSPIEDLEMLCSKGLISATLTRVLLLPLLQSTQDDVVQAAIKALGNAWSTVLPCPDITLLPLLDNDNVAECVLTTLSKWKTVDFLIEFASGEHDRYKILHTLSLIDAPLDGLQITALLDIAMTDAYFFAPAVVRVLRNQHRRRHNFSKLHIAHLFQLFLLAPTIEIEALSEIVRPSEKPWLRLLADLHPQDRHWKQHIQLIQRINTPSGNHFLLTRLSDLRFEALHVEMISALGKNGCFDVETQGLALLKKGQTEKALVIIRDIGGALSKQCLWSHIDNSATILGLSKASALSCVLSIEENIHDILNLIPTTLLSGDQLPILTATASPEVTDLLLSRLNTGNSSEKLPVIKQLGHLGGATCLEPLTAQLLLLDADDITTIHDAIQQIGKRLYVHGSVRPQVLRYAKSADQASEWVLTDCILTLCEHSALSDEILGKLLEIVSTLQCHHADKRLLPYLDHHNPQIQKHAIMCLCHNDCKHLSNKLRYFLQEDNIHTRRAALIGFTKLQATWLSVEVAESLNHPNMNIKKAAAEALASIGTIHAVPLILKWLAKHDNQGLKDRLIQAMELIAGNAYLPLVLNYLSQRPDSEYAIQEQRNLLLALNHKLSARAVVIAYQSNETWAKALIELIHRGEYQLNDAQGPSHLAFEAWRLGVTLVPETAAIPFQQPVMDTDSWLRCLVNDDITVGSHDIAQWVRQETTLSTSQTIRLTRQLPILINQLSSPQYGEASLKVLSLLVEKLGQGQKILLSTVLLQQLQLAKLPFESLLKLLKKSGGMLPNKVAIQVLNTSSPTLQQWGLNALIDAEALDKSHSLTLLSNQDDTLHYSLINYMLKMHWHQEALNTVAKTNQPLVEALRTQWCNISNSETIECLIKALPLASDSSREALLEWAACLQGDKIDTLLVSYLNSSVSRYRSIAINALALRPSTTITSILSGFLTHTHSNLRQASATILLAWPSDQYMLEIVKQYLQGSIRDIGYPRLSSTLLDGLADGDLDEPAKKKMVNLLCHSMLSAHDKMEYLWPLLDDKDADVRVDTMTAIRGLPAQSVLDYLWPALEAGQWGYLTLLSHSSIQRELIERLKTGNQETQQALLTYFLSLSGPIRGERLLDTLLSIESPVFTDCIVQLIGKLSVWEQPKQRLQLLDFIQRYIADGGDQGLAIVALKQGIERLTIHDQLAAIQPLLNKQTQVALLPEWTERCLLVPSSIHDIANKWKPMVITQLIEFAQDRDEDKARGALKLIVENDIETALNVLDDALHHPKSRVRAYAHRLLRKVASKEHYLDSTLTLLTDRELALRCSAIRTLAFRGYLPAVKGIVEQLYVKKKNVAQVAKASLIAMGVIALPSLKQAASHARPDQRVLLLEIIRETEGPS